MEFLDAHLDNEPGTMPVLSYHAAREEAEDKARKAERMNELEQEVPCQQSRVRSYTAKLDAIADANVIASNAAMASSVSPLRASAKAAPLQLEAPGGFPAMVHTPQVLQVSHGTPLTQPPGSRPGHPMLSPLGKAHTLGASMASRPMGTGMFVGAEVALGEIDALRNEIAELEGSLVDLKGTQVLSTLGRPVKGPRDMQALRESAYAKQHSASDGWRPSLKGPWKPGPLPPTGETGGFVGETQNGQPLFPMHANLDSGKKRPLLPASRKEAEVLQGLLDKNLPPGSITMKVQHSMFQPESAAGVSLVDLTVLEREFKLVDSVQRAASEQVAGTCMQRGTILDTIRQRYGEFFLVLSRLLFRLQEDFISKAEELRRTEVNLAGESEKVATLQDTLVASEMAFQNSEQERERIQLEFDMYRDESKELLAKMQSDKRSLEATVSHFEQRLQQSEVLRTEAISDATAALEDDVTRLIDERDDLLQRVRFFERQVAKLQAGMSDHDVSIEHQSTQTDDVEFTTADEQGAEEEAGESDADDYGMELDDQDEVSIRDVSIRPTTGKKSKKKGKGGKGKAAKPKGRRNVGGFSEFITSDKVGKVKPRSWVVKTIAQVYADKIVADATDDREHNDRQELCEYVFDWHLNRFGLKHLAENNVLDLVVSCRAYAKNNMKIRLFSHFTGLVDTASPFRESTEHINFYLMCLSHLAGQGTVTSLFPDTDEGIAWLKPAKVLIAIKNIFLAINDPDRHKDFMTDKVEPLQNQKSGMIDADVLLLVLLEDWSRHLELNTAHLKALFRAGDSDDDGFVTYDEFISLAMLVDDSIPDFRLAKLYRHALKATGGPDMVNVDAFVMVMRRAGQTVWRIRWNEAEGLQESMSFDTSVEPNPDDMFEILDSVLATTVPSLEDQLRTVRDKISEEDTILNMEKLYRSFMTKYSSRIDPEGAWLAYRLLVGKIAAILFQYRTGSLPTSPSRSRREVSSKALMEDIEAASPRSSAAQGSQRDLNRSASNSPQRSLSQRRGSFVPPQVPSSAQSSSSQQNRRTTPPRAASPLNTSNVHNPVAVDGDQFPPRPSSVEEALRLHETPPS